MLSTTLTVIDAYPRSLAAGAKVVDPNLEGSERLWHIGMIIGASLLGWLIIAFFPGSFTRLIDLITSIAFLTAPVFAFLNYRLVSSDHLPEGYRPGLVHRILSWVGLTFLVVFSLLFLWNRFLA